MGIRREEMSVCSFHGLVLSQLKIFSSLKGQKTVSGLRYRQSLGEIPREWLRARPLVVDAAVSSTLEEQVIDLRDNLLPRREIPRNLLLRVLKKIEANIRPLALEEDVSSDSNLIVFLEDQTYTALNKLGDVFRNATKEVLIADSYVDERTLKILSSVPSTVRIKILCRERWGKFVSFWPDFQREFRGSEVRESTTVHDRLFVIDGSRAYFSGPSLKDAGKKPGVIAVFFGAECLTLKDLFENMWKSGKPF